MNNLAFSSEIFPYRLLEIATVRIDLIHPFEFFSIHSLEYRSDEDIGRAEEKWNFLVVELPLIEEIAGDGVGVIDLSCVCPRVADGRKGIVAEYDRVVLSEELRMEEDFPLEIYLTKTPSVLILTEWDAFSGKSHGAGIESVRTEKERREIGTERLREHDIEPFGSSAVQEHIVDQTDFIFWRHKNSN